jgi:arylsulfatase A-like enzyme
MLPAVVFSSDNGGPAFSNQMAASNFPLRGGKHQLWEGGIRAAAFVSGGLLPPKMRGTNITALIHICDWWVTFAKLGGDSTATDGDGTIVPKLDGLDQWPVISGASTALVRSEVFPAKGVLIQGQWKLVVGNAGGTAMWSGPLYPKVPATGPATLACGKPGCLFDLEHDPEERHNLNGSAAHAGLIATMSARLAALERTIWQADPAQTNTTIEQVCAVTLAQGGWLTPADWSPARARLLE